jgi:hypothetical protein
MLVIKNHIENWVNLNPDSQNSNSAYEGKINSRIKDQWPEPSQGRQKGKAKERPKDDQLTGNQKKKKKELLPLMAGSYPDPRPPLMSPACKS